MASLQNRRKLFWAIIALDSLISIAIIVLILQGVKPLLVVIPAAVLFSFTGLALIVVLRGGGPNPKS